MPKKAEQQLQAQARELAASGKLRGKGSIKQRMAAYVYGTLRNRFGWRPKREKR